MLKKMFNLSSPVGIALTVAGVILALSPQARKATRQVLVKGTSLMFGAVESVKATAGVKVNMVEPTQSTGLLEEAVHNTVESTAKAENQPHEGIIGKIIDSVSGDHRPEVH